MVNSVYNLVVVLRALVDAGDIDSAFDFPAFGCSVIPLLPQDNDGLGRRGPYDFGQSAALYQKSSKNFVIVRLMFCHVYQSGWDTHTFTPACHCLYIPVR